MPIRKLEFEDSKNGLPRQPVSLRLAYLATGSNLKLFRYLIATATGAGRPRVTTYECGGDGLVRMVHYTDYAETIQGDLGRCRLDETLIAKLPKNHFVWSDEFVSEYKAAITEACLEGYGSLDAESLNNLELDWNPALHGIDKLIEECPDFSALLAKSESSTKTSRRELRKAQTEARNERLRECAARIREANPKLTNNALAEKIYRDKNQNEGLEKETIRGIISGKK